MTVTVRNKDIIMKQKIRLLFPYVAVVSLVLILQSCSESDNWPQFRGPDAKMTSENNNLPVQWANNKNIAWMTKLDGKGWSSPIVWGNKIFVSSTIPVKVNPVSERPPMGGPPPEDRPGNKPRPEPPQGQPGQNGTSTPHGPEAQNGDEADSSFLNEIYQWEISCYELKTGKEVWKQVAFNGPPRINKNPQNTYASETPVTDGKRVYVYFGMTGLFCYDMEGKLLWKKDLGAFKTQNGWGTGSSPVIYNNILILQNDNEVSSFIAAFNSVTGEELWRVTRDEKTTYSTPFIWKNKVREELVTGGKTVRSYDPVTGKLLWQLKTGGEQVIPSPSGTEDLLYIGNAGGRETKGELFAVKAGFNGELTDSAIAWKSADSGLGSPSPLLYNGLLYVIGSRGEISVFDASSGALKYNKKIAGSAACWASPWASKNKINFTDEKGITRVFAAGPEFNMLAENKLDDKIWGSVAIAGDAYIFRGAENLFCVKK
jgi:outer membrane protein assembly factor BamB